MKNQKGMRECTAVLPSGVCPDSHQSAIPSPPVLEIVLSSWCLTTLDIEVIAHLTDEEAIKSVANYLQKIYDCYIFLGFY